MIPLLEPFLGGNERKYIDEALAANQPSLGPFVERFEEAFAEYVGSKHAVAVSSGTAAIHLALRVLGVGPGDEVLAPDFTFVATANPIRYVGAEPVLVDAELHVWGMDPLFLTATEVVGRTAVISAHLYGHPACVPGVVKASAPLLPVIEDASEALGATIGGRHVGTFGTIGCFSFNGNKIITTGQGGMLVTDYADIAGAARYLRAQAKRPGPEYVHDEVGYNYRMSNINAAMGLAQLEQLPRFLERKREIAARYDAALPVRAPRASWAEPSFWLYSIQVPDPEGLRLALAAEGIEARPLWTPLHKMAPYSAAHRIGGQVAERLHAHGISLPSSVGLTLQDQGRVIEAVKRHLTQGKVSSMVESVGT